MSLGSMAFILGGLLLAIGLVGGGIEVRELKIPSVGRTNRILCFIVGTLFIGLAIFFNPRDNETPSSAGNIAPAVEQPTKAASGEKDTWLTSAQQQQEFDKQVKEGFYPSQVDGRCENNSEQFHAEWKPIPLGTSFFSNRSLTKEVYDLKNNEHVSNGFNLESLNIFKDCSGIDRYQATWLKTE